MLWHFGGTHLSLQAGRIWFKWMLKRMGEESISIIQEHFKNLPIPICCKGRGDRTCTKPTGVESSKWAKAPNIGSHERYMCEVSFWRVESYETMWMFLLKSIRFEWANKILVSSAKIIGAEVLFIILGKSFIHRRKSRGPKTEQCGTPCLTLAQLYYCYHCHYILLF